MLETVRSLIIALSIVCCFSLRSMSLDKIAFPEHGNIKVENLHGNITIYVREDNTLLFSASSQPIGQQLQKLPWIKIDGENILGKLLFSKILYFLDTERIDISLHVPNNTRIEVAAADSRQVRIVGDYQEESACVQGAVQRTTGFLTATIRPKL